MIWGLTLKPGEVYPVDINDEEIQLSMAALKSSKRQGEKSVLEAEVFLHANNTSYLLCTLVQGVVYQQNLDLKLNAREKLSFSVLGEGTVYITGYTSGFIERSEVTYEDEIYGYGDEPLTGDESWIGLDGQEDFGTSQADRNAEPQQAWENEPQQVVTRAAPVPLQKTVRQQHRKRGREAVSHKPGNQGPASKKQDLQDQQQDQQLPAPAAQFHPAYRDITVLPENQDIKAEPLPNERDDQLTTVVEIDDNSSGWIDQNGQASTGQDTIITEPSTSQESDMPMSLPEMPLPSSSSHLSSPGHSLSPGQTASTSGNQEIIPWFSHHYPMAGMYQESETQSKLNQTLPRKENRSGQYACSYCNKVFRHQSSCSRHKLTHTCIDRYVCKVCGKCFVKYTSYRRHEHMHETS